MVGSVRVFMSPIPEPADSTLRIVSGVRIGLNRLGAGSTLATRDSQSAELVFQLALIGRVRDPEDRTEKPLGTLSGTLSLEDDTTRPPRFTVEGPDALVIDPGVAGDPNDPAVSARAKDPRRALRLEFDQETIDGPEALHLPLPADMDDGVRYVELSVELQVAGAVESPREANDILDKPIVFPAIPVQPSMCLDTDIKENGEHNVAFFIQLPDANATVASVLLDGKELDQDHFFAHERALFFRPADKPSATIEGLLVLSDDRAFDFELEIAKTVRDKMDSLSTQLANGAKFAEAAAERARSNGRSDEEAAALRDELQNQVLHEQLRLLDSIQESLSEPRDLRLFIALAQTLPAVRGEITA